MIKLKNSVLNNQRIFTVFQALMNEKMPVKAAYKMKRYADKLDQRTRDLREFMQMALQKYGDLDENGNPKIENNEEGIPVGYKLKDSDAFKVEVDGFMGEEFEIEVNPLYAAELDAVTISPNDLIVLEPFIADLANL